MQYHRIGYFVVMNDVLDELSALNARWWVSLRELHDDTQVLTNQLYRRAQDRAVSAARSGRAGSS